jgi:predicted RNA binding protein YcfA (HicA-like mRNA interferase family)
MSRLPSVTGKQVLAALNRMGFQEIRVRGSHHYLRHTDGRATVVPVHAGETIGRGFYQRSSEMPRSRGRI